MVSKAVADILTPDDAHADVQRAKPHLDKIASLGRKGDTILAHLSEGDIVVPQEIINSKAMAELKKKLGSKIDRYTVGHRANSINPRTGLREFQGDGGGDFGGDFGAGYSYGMGSLGTGDPGSAGSGASFGDAGATAASGGAGGAAGSGASAGGPSSTNYGGGSSVGAAAPGAEASTSFGPNAAAGGAAEAAAFNNAPEQNPGDIGRMAPTAPGSLAAIGRDFSVNAPVSTIAADIAGMLAGVGTNYGIAGVPGIGTANSIAGLSSLAGIGPGSIGSQVAGPVASFFGSVGSNVGDGPATNMGTTPSGTGGDSGTGSFAAPGGETVDGAADPLALAQASIKSASLTTPTAGTAKPKTTAGVDLRHPYIT